MAEVREAAGAGAAVAWLYTPMALPLAAPARPRRRGLRLHGRALALRRSAAASWWQREAELLRAGGRRLHRRAEPVPRQAGAPPERPLLPQQRGCGAFRPGAGRAGGARRMQADSAAAPAAGLLRRHRRAPRPAAARRGGRRAARMADRPGRAGGQDRPGRPAPAPEHPLPRAAALRRAAGAISPAGTSACCRSPSTSRPASSARPRRWNTWRPSGPSSARRSPTWPSRTATSSTWAARRRRSSPPASGRSPPTERTGPRAERDARRAGPDLVGRHRRRAWTRAWREPELAATAHGRPKGLSHATQVDPPSSAAPPVLVIGAGPTGLSAAYHLGEEALLLEQADRVGGWCRSVEDNGLHVRHGRPHHVLKRPVRARDV